MAKKGFKSKQDGYTVQIKYSKKAEKDKLIKIIPDEKTKEIVLSADKLVELVAQYVNSETLAPMLVDTEKINVVYVKRQFKAKLDKDFKAGEEINIEYSHPYPLEFALIEEGFKIAEVDKERKALEVTPDMITLSQKNKETNENFLKKFYKSFANISLGDKT